MYTRPLAFWAWQFYHHCSDQAMKGAFIISLMALAAQVHPQTVIDVEKKVEGPIGLSMEHYYDPDHKLPFSAIQETRFVLCKSAIPSYGYNTGADWLKFKLTNTGSREVFPILRIKKPILDSLELFWIEGGQLKREITGALVVNEQEYKNSTSNYFRINLHPGDTTEYYLKVVSMHSKQLSVHIDNDYSFATYEKNVTITIGFYFGALLIITLYNLFIGLGIKDPIHLLYALSNLGSLLSTLTLKGFFSAYVFNNHPDLAMPMIALNIIAFSLLSPLFCIKMVNIRSYSKVAYWMFIGVMVFGIVAVFYPYFMKLAGHQVTYLLLSIGSILFTIVAVGSGIIAIKRGNRNAKYYLIAWIIGLIGVVLYVMLLVGWLPVNYLTENLYVIGSIFEVLALSFALADRYNRIQIRKNQLERDLRFRENDLAMVISDNKMRYQFKNALLKDLEGLDKATGPEELKSKIRGLVYNLRMQVEKEAKFDFFEDQLENINAEFESRIKEKYPDLTQAEIEIIYLIKLKLSNKDIAHFRNTTEGAIKVAKHRIRKKFQQQGLELTEIIESL